MSHYSLVDRGHHWDIHASVKTLHLHILRERGKEQKPPEDKLHFKKTHDVLSLSG
jgi:hypothetical protein